MMKNKQIIKLQPNSKISINENNELIIETEIDPCEDVIYTTLYNNGNSVRISKGTLSLYLKNNAYSKNTLMGEIYSFTGEQKIQIIKDAYIQGYRDNLNKQIIELLTNEL